jgi:DNA-binding transcriptional MerR regulator
MPGGEDGTDIGTGPRAGRSTRDVDRSSSKSSRGRSRGKQSAPRQGELIPDGKLYYRIGEVAKITGVKAHVLRYWETEFRWMAPPKSRSKQRLYRRKDIEMILVIKRLLYEERYTIAGARQQLRELGLAKALESGVSDTLESTRSVPETSAAAPDLAADSTDPVVELRHGYRLIRSELESIRALL